VKTKNCFKKVSNFAAIVL